MARDINSMSLWEGTFGTLVKNTSKNVYTLDAVKSVLEIYPEEIIVNTHGFIVAMWKVGNNLA